MPKPLAVLITGGAGFIGTRTARALLRAGHRVRLLDVLDPQIHGRRARFPPDLMKAADCRKGDVRESKDIRKALENVTAVLHLAAQTGVGQSMYEIQRYVDTNVLGTAALLEAVVRARRSVKKLVLASSRAVYGEGRYVCAGCGPFFPDSRPGDALRRGEFDIRCVGCGARARDVATPEDAPLHPSSIYGMTKLQQEDLCRQVESAHGLSVVRLRYFNVYGAGQSLANPYTGIVSIFYGLLRAGKPISLYEGGRPRRDFVHVDDVAAANRLALEGDHAGGCFNVGSGERVGVQEMAAALAAAMGKKARFVDRGEFRVGDVRSCWADLTRSKRVLGYVPGTSLTAGLREFCRWAEGKTPGNRFSRSVQELRRKGLFKRAAA